METLERSRVCRLCGKQAGMTIHIFDKRGNHMKKINTVLPILVHEMDLLPKHMCHYCNYKLDEFHKFYEDCRKTDAHLKSQLSWMQGSGIRDEKIVPMVQINNVKIKTEPPDYVEHEIAEAILSKEKITSYDDNNYSNFRENLMSYDDSSRCTRCGLYCDDRNDDSSRNCTKLRSKERNSGMKKNDTEYSSRDMIRRNLFATEIFGNKNSRIQTEIPVCNVSRRFFNEKEIGDGHSDARSRRRWIDRKNGISVKTEIAEISTKFSPRKLRPRKVCPSALASSRESLETKKNKMNRKMRIVRAGDKGIADSSALIEIKTEIPDNSERSLRPRTDMINYSESKRKVSSARGRDSVERVKKIKISRDDSVDEKFLNDADNAPIAFTEKINSGSAVSSSFLVVKLERDSFASRPKKRKINNGVVDAPSLGTRNNRGKTLNVIAKEGIFMANIYSKVDTKEKVENLDRSSGTRVKRSNRREADETKRNVIDKSTLWLRSKIGYSKNDTIEGNMRTWYDDKTSARISRYHQDCDTCGKRFASQELYRLHDCYANKRN